MDVSIIIVNYNTYALTRQCIASVIKFTRGVEYEIILVDNASSECDPQIFKKEFTGITLVGGDSNLGFAGGNNLGIQFASGKYILLLNSDTYLKDNAILVTFNYMEQQPAAGVVSARLIFPNGKHQSVAQRFPSIKYQLIELMRLQKLMTRTLAGKILLGAFFDHQRNVKADWVWGAYFMFRSEILNKLPEKKLDDTYFMYFEDVQWCMDMKRLGYEIHFCADAEVIHIMGGSSANKTSLMEKNGTLFMQRNFSVRKIWWIKKIERLLAS